MARSAFGSCHEARTECSGAGNWDGKGLQIGELQGCRAAGHQHYSTRELGLRAWYFLHSSTTGLATGPVTGLSRYGARNRLRGAVTGPGAISAAEPRYDLASPLRFVCDTAAL